MSDDETMECGCYPAFHKDECIKEMLRKQPKSESIYERFRKVQSENDQLKQKLTAATEIIKNYAGHEDTDSSWQEPDQHLMYWTFWNDGDCIGPEMAIEYLRVNEEKK